MTAIQVESFGGVAPIQDPRKLAARNSTVATDCKFHGTDLVPLMAHALGQQFQFAVGKLFKYQFQGQSNWLAWPAGNTVDVANSPIPQDTLGRLYWSSVNPATINNTTIDNFPRMASQPTQIDIINNTARIRRLGVPAPTAAPTITENKKNASVNSFPGGTITGMSSTSPVTVSTSGTQPFANGQTVIVEIDSTSDGGMKEISGLQFVVTNCQTGSFDLVASNGTTYTKFTAGATKLTISRVYLESDLVTRSYVYTFVTDLGEEGMPSPPSPATNFNYDSTENVSAVLSGMSWASSYINRVRIYRTESGTSGANFFFTKEVPLGVSASSFSAVDDVKDAALGELLPSATWLPPPNGLQGLVAMPNGFLAGFVGNTLYFSEPYMPHAWPAAYTKTTPRNIVGIAVYGQSLVVATQGKPQVGAGSDPSSVTLMELDFDAPCLSKGSLCSTGTGVAYAAPDGLAFVSAFAQEIITVPYFSLANWQAAFSPTMQAIFHESRYIAFSTDATRPTMIVENRPDIGMNMSFASVLGTAPAIDPDNDTLNFIGNINGVYIGRYVWEGGASAQTATWVSRTFTAPHAVNPSVCRVFAQSYPVTLKIGYANFTSPYGQTGAEITTQLGPFTVAGSEPFRLPGGYLSREFSVTVTTNARVQMISISDNFDELR